MMLCTAGSSWRCDAAALWMDTGTCHQGTRDMEIQGQLGPRARYGLVGGLTLKMAPCCSSLGLGGREWWEGQHELPLWNNAVAQTPGSSLFSYSSIRAHEGQEALLRPDYRSLWWEHRSLGICLLPFLHTGDFLLAPSQSQPGQMFTSLSSCASEIPHPFCVKFQCSLLDAVFKMWLSTGCFGPPLEKVNVGVLQSPIFKPP